MEMSHRQRIRFWYQILLEMHVFFSCFFLENDKKSLFSKINCDKLEKKIELKMLKLLENHVKTLL